MSPQRLAIIFIVTLVVFAICAIVLAAFFGRPRSRAVDSVRQESYPPPGHYLFMSGLKQLEDGYESEAFTRFWQADKWGHPDAWRYLEELRKNLPERMQRERFDRATRTLLEQEKAREAAKRLKAQPASSGRGTKSHRSDLVVNDIWIADVPFEDTLETKRRPCLLVRISGQHVEVMKITSTVQPNGRPVRLPGSSKTSWIATRRTILISVNALHKHICSLRDCR